MGNEVAVKFSDQLSDKLVAVESALPKDFNRERLFLTVKGERLEPPTNYTNRFKGELFHTDDTESTEIFINAMTHD